MLNRQAAPGAPFPHPAIRGLSRAADHGGLWIVLAAGLAATRGKWARRAALRGLAGAAIGGTVASAIRGTVAGRAGPSSSAGQFAVTSFPVTSFPAGSLPSGAAASAAAFATGVALEMPALAIPAGGLAAAVGVSRALARGHHSADVAAGFALGSAAGLVTLRWWARRPVAPAAAARPRREAPASPDGAGVVMIVNCSAGTASQDLAESLGKSLPAAEVIVASAEEDLAAAFRDAARRAAILGVAGGDGSVRVAAGIASEAGLPLLVVPAGTFNHFAADLGVESADDALAALHEGDSVLVDVAAANGDAFVNTASTGVYVDLVRAREEVEQAFGKWPAVLIALVHVLRHSRPVDLLVNGRRRQVWLLFAGNCRYEPSGAAPAYRPDLADGTLDVRLIDGSQPLARTRLIAAVLLGTLGRSRVYRAWSASEVHVASADGDPVPLCLDGERTGTSPTARLVKRPKKLLVYRPPSGD